MISIQKNLNKRQRISKNNQLNLKLSPQLVARWQMIDGKLVCQWIKV